MTSKEFMQLIIIISILIISISLFLIFYDNSKEEEVAVTFISCGEYGYVSEVLFINSEYCQDYRNERGYK